TFILRRIAILSGFTNSHRNPKIRIPIKGGVSSMNAAVVPTAHSSPTPIQPIAIEGPVPLHLLVVDSDRFVREVCKEAAAALGYHTTATGSADQAFWLIDS